MTKEEVINLAEYIRTHFSTEVRYIGEVRKPTLLWKSRYSGNNYTDKDVAEFFLDVKHKQI